MEQKESKRFKKLVKKCGFILAIKIMWPTLSQDKKFLDSLTFDQWKKIYFHPEAYDLSFQKMEEMATDSKKFELWEKIYLQRSFVPDNLLKKPIKMMEKLALTFNQWKKIYSYTKDESSWREEKEKLNEKAIQKMGELAKNIGQWADVYHLAAEGSSLKEKALKEISKRTKTFNGWEKLFNKYGVFQFLQEMATLAKTFKQWKKIYFNASEGDDSHLKIMACKNMICKAKTFNELKISYSYAEEDLKNETLKKMFILAKTFEQYKWIYLKPLVGSSYKELALQKMRELAEKF